MYDLILLCLKMHLIVEERGAEIRVRIIEKK